MCGVNLNLILGEVAGVCGHGAAYLGTLVQLFKEFHCVVVEEFLVCGTGLILHVQLDRTHTVAGNHTGFEHENLCIADFLHHALGQQLRHDCTCTQHIVNGVQNAVSTLCPRLQTDYEHTIRSTLSRHETETGHLCIVCHFGGILDNLLGTAHDVECGTEVSTGNCAYVHHTGSHVFLWYETCGQLLGEECHSGNGNKQCAE